MPSRILREGIVSSERVNKLSEKAEVFYRRLMSVVDDYGRYFAHPAILRTACYPLRLDTTSEADIKQLLGECVDAGLVLFYNAGKHIQLTDFKQQTRSASKFPQPTEEELLIKCKADDKRLPRVFVVGVGVGVEDVGVVGVEDVKRKEGGCAPTLAQVKTRAEMTAMPEEQAVAFWNHFESSGWIDKHGHPVVRWESKMDNWKTNARAAPFEQAHRNGSHSGKKPLSVLDLKNIIEAKRSLANSIKTKHSSEVAMGTSWSDPGKKQEFFKLHREMKTLETQIAQMA